MILRTVTKWNVRSSNYRGLLQYIFQELARNVIMNALRLHIHVLSLM